jgi:hypothetical protein
VAEVGILGAILAGIALGATALAFTARHDPRRRDRMALAALLTASVGALTILSVGPLLWLMALLEAAWAVSYGARTWRFIALLLAGLAWLAALGLVVTQRTL